MLNQGRQLHGSLSIELQNNNQKTVITSLQQTSPLHASHALYPKDAEHAFIYLMETSGGMVSGDSSKYYVQLSQDTKATLIQQSATKVYPCKQGETTKQITEVSVSPYSYLRLIPESIILYEDAELTSVTRLELTRDSHLLWGEILASGRKGKGENYHYRFVDINTSIYIDSTLSAYDRFRFSPYNTSYKQLGILDGAAYYATLWAYSPHFNDNVINELALEASLTTNSAVTQVTKNLYCLRWLSDDLIELKRAMKLAADTLETYIL
ncbi:urease accessory protein UreD [Marinococcus halotolerans]|uniref:urease accessory protein UreD n=1 Tax=Marinococcus halotolerans TaxID=301092 RepID=UPI0003B765EC|nr:urease accessory protein UreD [Marinococcus halotolerans]